MSRLCEGPAGSAGLIGRHGDVSIRPGRTRVRLGIGHTEQCHFQQWPQSDRELAPPSNPPNQTVLMRQSPWPNPSQLLYLVSGLDPAIPHTIKLVNLEGKRFSVDRMVVTQNGAGTSYVRPRDLAHMSVCSGTADTSERNTPPFSPRPTAKSSFSSSSPCWYCACSHSASASSFPTSGATAR